MTIISQAGICNDQRAKSLSFSDSEAWQVSADKPWWALVDIRDMLSLFHPFVVSETGKSAGSSRSAIIPSDWKPPFSLRFYCADDYFADADKHKPGQLGTESFFEHRFKQVLIDDKVIWERDVCDENVHSSQTIFQVDITPYVKPEKPFKLIFRVFDKTSTLERNDRDVWFIGGVWYAKGDGKTKEPPRFHTAVWFADPVIGEQKAVEEFPFGKRPHEADVQKRHAKRLPIKPRGMQMPSPVIKLKLKTPASMPAPGYLITCGIPMPPHTLTNEKFVKLYDDKGNEIPIQTKTTGLWQDGSIRWLLLNAIAPTGYSNDAEFRLRFNDGEGIAPKNPIKIEQNVKQFEINTSAITIKLGADNQTLVDSITITGKNQPVMANLKSRMSILMNGISTPVNATCHNIEIKDKGNLVTCIEISGSLDTVDKHIGRFIFRLYAYTGLSSLQTQFRIFNDVKPETYNGNISDQTLEVTDLALVADIPNGLKGKSAIGVVDSDPITSESGILSVIQETPEKFTASSEIDGKRSQGWINVSGTNGNIQASTWRFWQQYPKSLKADGDHLEIGLFAPVKDTPLYKPRFGETKRQDIWFNFADKPIDNETQTALGLLADQPPRLFDSQWFCLSGGISLMDPDFYQNEEKLKKYTLDNYGDVSTQRVTGQFGIRNFGDMPYGSEQWRNGYWAIVQGALNWGVASDDQRWLERSFEIARHITDVDSVNIPTDHPDWNQWNGVICALGIDHSVHGGNALWAAFQVGESLVLHYWMTGDPDSLDSAIANADYLIRSQSGVGSVEARSQARPMLTLLRVWQATGDKKYLQSAIKYLDLKYQIQNVIDWRRGAYIQPTYENYRCVSSGLDSMYALNIYDYYRLTGDLDAAQLVVAIADSVYDESMLPQEEGIGSFLFYVRYSRGSWYYTQMATLFYSAYDLTGDIRFLRAGRAAFERYRYSQNANGDPMFQPYDNFGWMDPEFGGWQLEFKDVWTEPFHIDSQTPNPDPSAY